MFFDITSTVKKNNSLIGRGMSMPEPLSDTQNPEVFKKPEERVTKMPVKSDMEELW